MHSSREFSAVLENRVLAALPAEEHRRLLPHLEMVRLRQGEVLYHVGEAIRYAYFLRGGMASLLSLTGDGKAIEVGMIGNEGLVGVSVVLRSKTAPYETVMQLPGNAMRIRQDVLGAEFNRSGKLQELLLRYSHALLVQIAQSAACNRFHPMRERLCRWLLVSHDRVKTDTISLTQEFLAQMIGAPRSRVTLVAISLQESGLIRYSRGKIVILDRQRLENSSCECYKVVREQTRYFIAA
jgi:CRP-like cAMP-binding protein